MATKLKLPTGKQNFRNMRTNGFLYVDKTRQIYDLMNSSGIYFFSRPRRFGKTLLLSTFQEIFQGNKELFKGLYIYDQDYDWKEYAIVHLNFAPLGYKVKNLEEAIRRIIIDQATKHGVELEKSLSISELFWNLLELVYTKKGEIVLLIDEYDKPIIDFIEDLRVAQQRSNIIKDLFSCLKFMEAKGAIRFLFLTGVSKFAKVSLFSDLNNLTDLTVDKQAEGLVGISQEELEHYFKEYIDDGVKKWNTSKEAFLKEIKVWYNGYRWGETSLYNPYSLLNFFRNYSFQNYWYTSGTPSFLLKLIRNQHFDLSELSELEELGVDFFFFDKSDLTDIELFPLLFQTGYLTIKEIEQMGFVSYYTIGIPNREVRHSLYRGLFLVYTENKGTGFHKLTFKLTQQLRTKDTEGFITGLKAIFSDVSYHALPKEQAGQSAKTFVAWEGYYQSVVYLLLKLLDIHIQCEVTTNKGRIDAVITTKNYLYIMEFKMGEAEEGMTQIKAKGYAEKYQTVKQEVVLFAIGFDREARNIGSYLVEEM